MVFILGMSRVGGIGGGGYMETNFRIRIRIQSCRGIWSTKWLCAMWPVILIGIPGFGSKPWTFLPIMKQLLEDISENFQNRSKWNCMNELTASSWGITCSMGVSVSHSVIIPPKDSWISPLSFSDSPILRNLYFGSLSISSLVAPSCYHIQSAINLGKEHSAMLMEKKIDQTVTQQTSVPIWRIAQLHTSLNNQTEFCNSRR